MSILLHSILHTARNVRRVIAVPAAREHGTQYLQPARPSLSPGLCKDIRLRMPRVSHKPHFTQDDSYLVLLSGGGRCPDFFFFPPAAGFFPRRAGLPARLCSPVGFTIASINVFGSGHNASDLSEEPVCQNVQVFARDDVRCRRVRSRQRDGQALGTQSILASPRRWTGAHECVK